MAIIRCMICISHVKLSSYGNFPNRSLNYSWISWSYPVCWFTHLCQWPAYHSQFSKLVKRAGPFSPLDGQIHSFLFKWTKSALMVSIFVHFSLTQISFLLWFSIKLKFSVILEIKIESILHHHYVGDNWFILRSTYVKSSLS